jgi:tRNA A37 threonylcarbamoyladenosine dehydratase
LDFDFRFGGIQRLIGKLKFERLRSSHVVLLESEGVGSWSAEALARSGIGHITLVDYDDICESNINRQVHSLDGVIGRAKDRCYEAAVASDFAPN